MLDEAGKVSDDELRRGFTRFRMELRLDLPADPYSPEYRAKVFELYEWLHGSPYTPANEVSSFDVVAAADSSVPLRDREPADGGEPPHRRRPRHPHDEPGAPQPCARAGRRLGQHDAGARADGPRRDRDRHRAQLREADRDSGRPPQRAGTGAAGRLLADRQRSTSSSTLCCSSSASTTPPTTWACSLAWTGWSRPGGRLVFAAEPITDSLRYPWCLRLDGESLWAIRKNGWFELGFQETYFRSTLARFGWQLRPGRVPGHAVGRGVRRDARRPRRESLVVTPLPRGLRATLAPSGGARTRAPAPARSPPSRSDQTAMPSRQPSPHTTAVVGSLHATSWVPSSVILRQGDAERERSVHEVPPPTSSTWPET